MQSSRIDNLHSITIHLDLNTARACIIPMGDSIVDRLGNHAVWNFLDIIRRCPVRPLSNAIVQVLADKRYRPIGNTKNITFQLCGVLARFFFFRTEKTHAFDKR